MTDEKQHSSAKFRNLPDGRQVAINARPLLVPMTDAEVHAAALADPDALPLSDAGMARMRPVPRAETVGRALGLTLDEFALRFHIAKSRH